VIRNLIKESVAAPGTGTTVTLSGAQPGYGSFTAFGNAQLCYYMLTDGSQSELQAGAVLVGSPNTLARGTPIWTSTGGNTRLNFTGTTTAYAVLPAERVMYADVSSIWQGLSRRLTGLAAATATSDAPRFDQVGWRLISSQTWASAIGGAVFALPSGHTRFRLEWNEVLPASAVAMFYRFSFDGGATYAQGVSDYDTALNVTVGSANAPSQFNATGYGILAGAPAAGWPWAGFYEFAPASRSGSGLVSFQTASGHARSGMASRCGASVGVTPTHIIAAAVGQNLSSGNMRLLGGTL
jgi:hypothetical protein